MKRHAIAMALTITLGGCTTLTPDYERPQLDVPAQFIGSKEAGESISNLTWWKLLSDEQLQALIRTALENNKDLLASLARISEARQLLIVTQANQYPFIDILGDASRGRQSKVLVPSANTRSNYAVGADLSFELDLWGKLRRATEASQADLLSTEASYRNVTISLVSSVANAYLILRDLDERLAISERTVVTRQHSLDIIQARFDKGTVSELDVNQAQIELAVAQAAVSVFQRQVIQTENALQVLLGNNPGPVKRGESLEQQAITPDVPAGLPSELLQRRPDLIAAEQRLAAETARIGVAEALRYPNISLTGSLGLASDDLSDLTSSDAQTWNLAGNLLAPIFNSGQLKAQANAQRARAEQALLAYQSTLQNAFREVEDALVAVRTYRAEHGARQRQAVAARNAARLSRARYDGGVVDYLEVLDSERSLFNAELDESATLQQYLTAIVQLYKALGGGWNPEALQTNAASNGT